MQEVALRKESVDRNNAVCKAVEDKDSVALRKESVDRNVVPTVPARHLPASLSARRAWIEMVMGGAQVFGPARRSPQGERG